MEFTEHPRPQTGQQQRMTSQGGNMQTIRFFYASSAIAFAAALVTAPANAQDAVPAGAGAAMPATGIEDIVVTATKRSEEHTSELQSLMRISYAVFCLKKKKTN